MEKFTCDINGTLLAETGIVHGEILTITGSKQQDLKEAEEISKQKENKNISYARRMTQILRVKENNEAQLKSVRLPAVSGNAFRGISRRLLVEHSFDVLDTSVDEIVQDFPYSDKVAHDVWFSFANGGLTPKGSSMKASSLKAYDEIASIPWLGLFGAVYYGHQFEGSASFGILYPLIKENAHLYRNQLPLFDEIIEELPDYTLLQKLPIAMNTRKANARDNSGRDSNETARKETGEAVEKGSSDAMIYGSQYIPAGVQFVSLNRCITHDENILKAFKASIALFLETHRVIGGKSSAGFGRVRPHLGFDFDTKEAIHDYDQMLLANKDDIIRKIRMIPQELKFTMKESTARGKKAAKEKEAE